MEITRDLILERVQRVKDLPPFPQVVLRLQQAMAEPSASARRIALVIEEEPALSARFLKVANSAFYGGRYGAVSVRQAVVRLGLAESRRLAFATAIVGRLGQLGGPDPRRFWLHALVVALSTRVIAKQMPTPLAPDLGDAAFASGLLHDLGAMVLFHVFPDVCRRLLDEAPTGEPWIEVERARWGTDHSEVGDRVAAQWHLPDPIRHAIRHHHEPTAAPDEFRRLVAVVSLANALADASGFSRAGEPVPDSLPTHPAWAELALAPETAADLLADIGDEAVRSTTFLDLAT